MPGRLFCHNDFDDFTVVLKLRGSAAGGIATKTFRNCDKLWQRQLILAPYFAKCVAKGSKCRIVVHDLCHLGNIQEYVPGGTTLISFAAGYRAVYHDCTLHRG